MIVSVLLRNEMLKMFKRLAFWVTYIFFVGILLITYADQFVAAKNNPNRSFALPDAWSRIVSSDVEATMFFGTIVLMLLLASEFTWRTARQNVIDGLSKEQWFLGKLLLVPILGLLFVGAQIGIGVGFALLGESDGAGPMVRPADWSAILGFALAFVGTACVGFFIALAVRASGPAIGVWFLYMIVVEQLLAGGLVRLNENLQKVVQYLPFNTFQQLTRYRLHSDEVFQAAVAQATQAGRTPPEQGDLGMVLGVAIAWIVVLIVSSFVWFRQRDL